MTHIIQNTTYSSAFPPLQSFPWPSAKKNSGYHASSHPNSTPSTPSPPLYFMPSLAPPKYPAYLKSTGYASLVTEQYQHLQQKKKRNNINQEYNKELEEADLRLPQYWNLNDKSRHIDLGLNGFDITFNAAGTSKRTALEAAAIRTNFPVRPQCGVYYYEVRILSMGDDGLFAVGFCSTACKLDKLPGFYQESFGYHGQDGQVYHNNASCSDKLYGPSFSSGDVIGCGIDFANETIFFTKNGVSLGVAFESIHALSDLPLYPCVGLGTQGEKITANFGHEEFSFDIVNYIKDRQKFCKKNVCIDTSDEKYANNIKSRIDQLVLSYLSHQGYIDTFHALKKNIAYTNNLPTDTTTTTTITEKDTRSHIRKLMMSGQIDQAIEETEAAYPNLLENNPDLMFQLKSRKLLEILINENDLSLSLCLSDTPSSDDTDDDTFSTHSGRSRALSISSDIQHQTLYEEQQAYFGQHHHHPSSYSAAALASPPPQPLHVAASGRRMSWAAIAASPVTEVEEHTGRRRMLSVSSSSSNGGRRNSHCSSLFDDEDDDSKTMAMVRRAMHYGQQLQEEYQHSKYSSQLMQLFTLLAYADPKSSPMAYMLDISRRDADASDLNNAIQAYQHQCKQSNLELILKQALATNKELALSGHGKASLLHTVSY